MGRVKKPRNGFLGLGLLVTGLCLLAGRFDWSTAVAEYSRRSFLASAYFFILLLPTIFFLLRSLQVEEKRTWLVTSGVGLIFYFPYQWVGLAQYYFHFNNPVMVDWREPGLALPEVNWFPNAFSTLPVIPGEGLLFAFMMTLGVGLISYYFRGRCFSKKGIPNPSWLIALGLFSLVVLQTWLHLSLRSPYTYIPHFEQPETDRYWYHYYLFPGGKGAVNMDYPVFRYAEDLFMGVTQGIAPLLGRVFPMYIASQFSLFVNDYYVWIVLNVALWCAGLISIYYLGNLFFGKQAALFSAVLFSSAQGVIVYVAQPKVYVFAICGISIILAIYFHLFQEKRFSLHNGLLYGVILGLFLLCYEAQPWLLAILAVALAYRFDFRSTFMSFVIAFLVLRGFIVLGHHLPHLSDRPALIGPDPVQATIELLKSHDLSRIFTKILTTVNGFFINLYHAFNLCLFPALLGLILVQGRKKLVLLCFCIPAVLTYALMDLGGSFYVLFPRLVYSAYPAIYILCGVFLSALAQKLQPKSVPWLGSALAWSFLGAHMIHANLDVWGYPSIYYFWFYRNAGFALN